MDAISIVNLALAVLNLCLTAINVYCAMFSSRQTKRQTDLMETQVKIAQQPNFALNGKLESIAKAIYHVGDKIKNK